jgi:hypothetical protein
MIIKSNMARKLFKQYRMNLLVLVGKQGASAARWKGGCLGMIYQQALEDDQYYTGKGLKKYWLRIKAKYATGQESLWVLRTLQFQS